MTLSWRVISYPTSLTSVRETFLRNATVLDPNNLPSGRLRCACGVQRQYWPYSLIRSPFILSLTANKYLLFSIPKEPERGRNVGSRPASLLRFDAEALNPSSGTQRSAFFPWDNAAGTSSSAGVGFPPSGDGDPLAFGIDKADVHLRGVNSSHSRSLDGSRRESSIVPSQSGSMVGLNIGFSPGQKGFLTGGDDFQFDRMHSILKICVVFSEID